jgi:peptidoglycan/LPS O-acetylase OafA/YrhL
MNGLARIRGLDGIRALSVAAVLAYHVGTSGGPKLLAGGFLGVDTFFVVSGFLITSLLLAEAEATGRISIRSFYARRARRLLPALYVVLTAVALAGVSLAPEQIHRLKGDIVAAVSYVTNWWLIDQNSSYFATGGDRPPLLNHLWSLAVEEQFYVVWPLLVIVALKLWRRPRRALLIGTLVLVAGSAALAYHLYDPFGDPSRVYFGTDTRAATPLIGAALAIALRPWRYRLLVSPAKGILADAAALIGLGGLGLLVATTTDDGEFIYRGGFLVVAAAAGALVAGTSHPFSRVASALDLAPLRWLGERSYGVYLWHWPVFVLFPAGSGPGVWLAIAGKLVVTLMLAAASYRFVERPIRRGLLRDFRISPIPRRRWLAARAVALTVAVAVAAGGTAVRLNAATPPRTDLTVDAGPAPELGTLTAPPETPATEKPATETPATPDSPAPRQPSTFAAPVRVTVFGDSQGMTLLRNRPKDLARYAIVTDATIEGCGIMLSRVRSRSGEKRNLGASCPNWESAWSASAREHRPQVALVMLGAWDVFDSITDSGTVAFGSPEWDSAFTGAVSRGVRVLHEAGAQVALSLLPCYRPVKGSAGFWPERGDDKRTRHVNTLLRKLAERDRQRIVTVQPPAAFCIDPKISRSTAYRWDGVHYYKPGAALYFSTVLPQLLAVPQPPESQ